MSAVADFHSHILPKLDDGSVSVEESLAMLRLAAQQGVRHMVATPHFYARHDTPERFLRRREQAAILLREAMQEDTGLPQVTLGAEVYFFSGISNSSLLSELAIGKKRCVLIEMPPAPWTPSMYRELEEIRFGRDLIPVIAHIDRYIRPFHTHKIPEQLREREILVQANASFFLRRETSPMAMRLLREGKIHFLGSDCHNMADRKPDLGPAVEKIERKLGNGAIGRLHMYEQEALEACQPYGSCFWR